MTYPITPDPAIHKALPVPASNPELAVLESLWAGLPQEIIQGLANAILRALGLSNFIGPLDELLAAVEAALAGGIGAGFQALIDAIVQAIKGNLTDVGNDLAHFLAALNNFFRGFSPLGMLRADVAHLLSAAHIVNLNPNLLTNPGFDTSVSVQGTAFTWDGTTGHTNLGSAKAVANGVLLTLMSNPISVFQGDSLNMSAWVEWSGVTTSGSSPEPIRIAAATYLAGALVSTTVLAGEATPGASSSWVQLSGTFTVPSGVDTIYLQCIVDTTCTAGNVWFDDGNVSKAGILAAGENLIAAFENTLFALFGANTIVGQLLRGLLPSILGGADLLADVQNIVDKIIQALGGSGTGHSLANLITFLESIPFGNILSVFGLTSLGADIQAVVDKIMNALGSSGTGHTLANLLAGLGAIPFGNILSVFGLTSIGADVQAIVDKAIQALGGSGTGHSLANLITFLQAIPVGNVLSIFGLANVGADIQAVVDKLLNGWGVSGTGHTLATLLATAGAIPGAVINGITGIEQNMVDFINQAINGGSGTGNAVSTVLSNIESHNVALPVVFDAVGSGGSGTSLGSSVAVTGSHTIGVFNDEVLVVAGAFAVSGGLGSHGRTCTWTPTGGSAQNLISLGAINSGGSTGSTAGWVELFYLLNPSTTPSFSGTVSLKVNVATSSIIMQSVSYGNVNNVASISTNSSTSNSNSLVSNIATIPDSSYSVSAFCASQSITTTTPGTQRALTNLTTSNLAGNLTFADVNGATVNGQSGVVAHSGTSASWGNVQAVLSPSHTHQNAFQTAIDQMVSNLTPGGGNLTGQDPNLVGELLSAISPLNVAGFGGPTTLQDTHQAVWDAAVQAIMGVTTTGHSIADFFNALLHLKVTANAAYTASSAQNNVQIFNASGTYTVPTGMISGNHFDIIIVGGGGGGAGGQYPGFGNGGSAGSWNAVTLTYGTSFPTSTTTMTVTVGTGGTAGATSGGTGGTGGSTSVAITGYASSPVTTSGGAGGSGINFSGTSYFGASPGNETFNSSTYAGGATQTIKSAAGNSPGGAGAGGYAVLGQAGGAGAAGVVIIVART